MVSSSARRVLLHVTCASAALGALVLADAPAHGGIIVVDDFSDTDETWPFSQTAVGSTGFSESGLAGVLGGSRGTTVGAESLAIPGADSVTIAIVPVPGIFDFTSSAGANGNFSLFYDGPAGDLNADLSALSAFGIEIVLFDFGNNQPMPVTITLDDGSNTAMRTEVVDTAGGQTLMMPFAGFTGIASVDLMSINSILIEFDPGLGNDVRIGAITVVPAPAGLAFLGVAGLLGSRRRRRA